MIRRQMHVVETEFTTFWEILQIREQEPKLTS